MIKSSNIGGTMTFLTTIRSSTRIAGTQSPTLSKMPLNGSLLGLRIKQLPMRQIPSLTAFGSCRPFSTTTHKRTDVIAKIDSLRGQWGEISKENERITYEYEKCLRQISAWSVTRHRSPEEREAIPAVLKSLDSKYQKLQSKKEELKKEMASVRLEWVAQKSLQDRFEEVEHLTSTQLDTLPQTFKKLETQRWELQKQKDQLKAQILSEQDKLSALGHS